MPRKFGLQEARDLIIRVGLTPLFTEYMGSLSKHQVKCSCGESFDLLFSTVGRRLKEDPNYILRCKNCVNNNRESKYTPESIRKLFADKNLILLLSDKEISELQEKLLNREFRKVSMPYQCVCGYRGKMLLSFLIENIQHHPEKGCKKCRMTKGSMMLNHRANSQKEVLEFEKKYKIEILNKGQIKRRLSKVCFRCSCGDLYSITLSALLRWKKTPICAKCQYKNKPQGSDHPSYNPELSFEDRQASVYGRGFLVKIWADLLRKIFSYTCQIVGVQDRKLNCHHIKPWKYYPKDRFAFSNGIVLKQDIHKEFHLKFGKHCDNYREFLSFYKEKTGKDLVESKIRYQIISGLDAKMGSLNLLDLKQEYENLGFRFIPVLYKETIVNSAWIISQVKRDLGLLPVSEISSLFQRDCVFPLKVEEFFTFNSFYGNINRDFNLTWENAKGVIQAGLSIKKISEGVFQILDFCSKLQMNYPGLEKMMFDCFVKKFNPSEVRLILDRRFFPLDLDKSIYSTLGFNVCEVYTPQEIPEDSHKIFYKGLETSGRTIFDCGKVLLKWVK